MPGLKHQRVVAVDQNLVVAWELKLDTVQVYVLAYEVPTQVVELSVSNDLGEVDDQTVSGEQAILVAVVVGTIHDNVIVALDIGASVSA